MNADPNQYVYLLDWRAERNPDENNANIMSAEIFLENTDHIQTLYIVADKGDRFKRRYLTILIDDGEVRKLYEQLKERFEDG